MKKKTFSGIPDFKNNKVYFLREWSDLDRKFFRHYFFLIFPHQTHLFWNIFFSKFWKILKIALFVSIREIRQIYEGAISLIYQPILINLDIKLIVLTRGIQWNKLQSNISINKNVRFLPLSCELCSKKNEKKGKTGQVNRKKIAPQFFWDTFPYNFKW